MSYEEKYFQTLYNYYRFYKKKKKNEIQTLNLYGSFNIIYFS